MSLPTQSRTWILNKAPTSSIEADTFRLETQPLPELAAGQALIRVDHLSNDPAQRGWMQAGANERRAYLPPIREGQAIRSFGIATVLKSTSEKWAEGARVIGSFGWYDYAVVDESVIRGTALDLPGKTTASLGILGSTGVTAYYGLLEIGKIKPEHTVVISGAAGAVGSACVQIAKNVIGCKKVIGIAGGKAKCDWVKSLGADDCVDYKDPLYGAHLAALLPDYADVYFENVGGDILNTMLPLVKRYGIIPFCGSIANYHGQPLQLSHFGEIVTNRLTLHGFLVLDFVPRWAEGVTSLYKWISEGKISVTDDETIVEAGIEDVPKRWQLLFQGGNRGKLITKIVH